MRQFHRWVDTEDDQTCADRQTTSLAALAVILVVVIISLFLVRELRYEATTQDCLISGRTNCGAFIAPP
jgi:hypothetical protein